MKFYDVVDQVVEQLKKRGRVSYRALQLEFDLSAEHLDTLKEELIDIQEVAIDREQDLAVLKVNARRPLPYLKLGRSDDLMPGETVERVIDGAHHAFGGWKDIGFRERGRLMKRAGGRCLCDHALELSLLAGLQVRRTGVDGGKRGRAETLTERS